MGDPFSWIEQECGEGEFFDDADTPATSPATAVPTGAAAATGFGGAAPSPTPHADAAMFMRSLPDSPCAASNDGDRARGLSKATAPNPSERDPVTPTQELARTSSGGLKGKSRVCSTKSRDCSIGSSVSPQKTPTRGKEVLGFGKSRTVETSKEDAAVSMNPSLEEIGEFRNQSLETLQDASRAVSSRRKLPDSILKPPTEEGNAGRRSRKKAEARPPAPAHETIPEVKDSAFPACLRDCVDMLSGNINVKLGDMDILNIAGRRGVAFPDPPWWAPGGYPPFCSSDK
ncbi:uncharacterized protein LOC109713665 isoform X2 [Ananas comosus]|uniref:Uncharacterized protein LOC109713665 isoform X2 n=1 Tax=Ananas comosus TaxID=4615 RepID=A0A6P5FB13_ANACO|nr:uncharacterized protein LOC109713665 isoform X2 [Ananas comosus]